MGDDLRTLQSQYKGENAHLAFETKLLRLEIAEMRSLLLRGEPTYSDIANEWVREVRQGDSRLVKVGGLVGKGDRIVRIGSIARNVTPKRNLSVSCLFRPR